MWITKSYNDTFQQEYKIQRKLLQTQGVKHTLELFDSEAFGQIALLDEGLLLKNFLYVQSEFLAHLSACTHKDPKRVLITGSFNLELAFEFLRHEDLQVDFLQWDTKVLESLISFLPHYSAVMEHKRFVLIPSLGEKRYDIILSLDPALTYAEYLSDDGVLITPSVQMLLQTQPLREQLENLGNFAIKMPFFVPLSLLQDCYIFASKLYHPTADIQLQRADMLEGLQYYHANLHISAFTLPKCLKSALLGVAKN